MSPALPWLAPALLALTVLAGPAAALESAPVASERARMTLAAEVQSVAPGQPFRLGLRQSLAPGWHTYWKNPGDAGTPPELSFTLPEGASATGFDWPAPYRMPFGPLVNYGYEGQVLLPLTVTPPADLRPGDVFTIEAEGSWLVCEKVCIPEEGVFRLDLPVEPTARPDPALAEAFRAAEASLPRPSPWPASLGFEGQAGALRLDSPDFAPGAVREAQFFPAEWGVLDHAGAQPMQVAEGALRLGLPRGAAPLPAGPIEGVLVLTDAAGARGAYTIAATPGAVPPPLAAAGSALPLWQAALWAALGGLILNLMPCVFPILAMKAMGIARLSGAARGAVRGHAASYTAGVVLSFLALAGAMLALRAAGGVAGWGFQFTSPLFVAFMGWLMLAVGLNLSGVFQIGGPVALGSGAASRGGHLGSFATGGLAVLVATPCTAPFMAAAIGAAMLMPPPAMLAVFAAMGLGMAAPYALLAVFPGLAHRLPRPGAWMERLKEILAFPMYGAALWLLWVLAQQVGPEGLAAALAGGLAIGFAAWALGRAQAASGPRGRWAGRGGAAIALLAALALLPQLGGAARAATGGASAATIPGEEPWSEARLAALRAEGRPVFVNMTAAWCITCKVNERVALSGEAVRQAFAQRNIAYLKGDWTDGGPAIAAVLRAHGREGVPLYLVYPAGGGAPTLLPQILTESLVLDSLPPG